MQGLKLRETSIRKIVDDSVKALERPNGLNVEVLYHLVDEAVWIDHERIVKVLLELETNAVESNADPSQGPTGTTIRHSLPRRPALKNLRGKVIVHDE